MRLPLLCASMMLMSLSQCWAVSFPEDEDPINVVDYHCKYPENGASHCGKSFNGWVFLLGKLKKEVCFLSNCNVFTGLYL